MKRYISLRTLAAAVTTGTPRSGGTSPFGCEITNEMRPPPESGPRITESHDAQSSARTASPT